MCPFALLEWRDKSLLSNPSILQRFCSQNLFLWVKPHEVIILGPFTIQPKTFTFKLNVTSFLCQNWKQMKLLGFFSLHIMSIVSVLVISFCAFFKISLYLQDSTFWVLNPLNTFKFLPSFLLPSLFKPKLNIPLFFFDPSEVKPSWHVLGFFHCILISFLSEVFY